MRNQIQISARSNAGKALVPLVRRRAREFLEALDQHGCELSISLVGDRRIHSLNRAWRGKDKPTDVLSFPMDKLPSPRRAYAFALSMSGGPSQLGDVVISTDTARRQAREYQRTVQQEVERYLAHGVLHLLGYDHQTKRDRARMAKAEETLLGRAGMLRVS